VRMRFRVSAWMCLVVFTACAPDVRIRLVPDESMSPSLDSQQLSQTHAVYIHDIGWVHFTPPGVMSHPDILHAFTRVVELKLLTRAATEKYGTIFVQHLGDLLRLDASVIKPNGEKKTLSQADIKKKVLVKNAFPSPSQPLDLYETALIFPDLSPGDILSYQYTRRGYVWSWDFSHPDAPVLLSRFVYPRPTWNSVLKFVINNPHRLPVEKIEKTFVDSKNFSPNGLFRSFTIRNLPTVKTVPHMILSSELMTNLRVFMVMKTKSMHSLGRVYFKWITRGKSLQYGFDKIADDITGNVKEHKEIAEHIHDWIKKNIAIRDPKELSLRYPYSEQPTLGLPDILKTRQATVERAAALTWMLLYGKGLYSKVILTTHPDLFEADPKLVTLEQFSQVFLSLEDGTLIDVSDRFVPFGKIPFEFEGRMAMWTDGKKGEWRVLERSTADQNVFRRNVVIKVQADGILDLEETWSMSGNIALEMRRRFGTRTDRQREKLLSELLHAVAPNARLKSFKVENLDTNLEKNLLFTLVYRLSGSLKSSGSQMFISLNPFIYTNCPKIEDSSRPYALRFQYAWRDEVESTFVLPEGLRFGLLPQGCNQSNKLEVAGLEFQTSCTRTGDDRLTIRRILVQGKHLVETKHFQQMKLLTDEFRSLSSNRLVLESVAGK